MGIGHNGGLTPILHHKIKPGSGPGVDQILEQNPVTSSFQILKAFAGRADDQSLTPTAPMLER